MQIVANFDQFKKADILDEKETYRPINMITDVMTKKIDHIILVDQQV